MRTRVGVIGNSHMGAIKIAWDAMQGDYPDISMEFFGSRSHTLTKTFMDGAVLKTRNAIVRASLIKSGGAPEVDLARYDVIWIVGGGVNLRTLAQMLKEKRIHPYSEGLLRKLRNGILASGARRREFVSRPFVVEAFRQRLARSMAGDLVPKFRSAVDTPIYLSHEPHLDEGVLKDKTLPYLRIVHRSGMGEAVAELFEECFRAEFHDLAGLISQPKDTVVKAMFTSEAYSLAGVGLATMATGPRSPTVRDHTHKNVVYGRRIVELFLASAGLGRPQI